MTRFDELILGSIAIKIDCFEPEKLMDRIYSSCKVLSLYVNDDTIYVTIRPQQMNKLFDLLNKSECIYEITNQTGFCYIIRKYIRRYGIILGTVLACTIVILLSNMVMKIEIIGTDDDKLKSEILGVLKNEGLYAGAFLPSINFMELESKLSSISDDIAWASIGHEGSLVCVNIIESTDKQVFLSKRIPSNIVASRDGIIVNAEVLSGKLCVLIGSAVSKGEILVSGIVERANGRAYYYHSIANITAEFDESFEIHQDYVCKTSTYGEVTYEKGLKFFDYELTLPSLRNYQGEFSKESKTVKLDIFGLELPFGIITNKYSEIITDVKLYTTQTALEEAYRRLEIIEDNLLEGNEIIHRNVTEICDETGVTLIVTYKLQGDIGKQVEIFAN